MITVGGVPLASDPGAGGGGGGDTTALRALVLDLAGAITGAPIELRPEVYNAEEAGSLSADNDYAPMAYDDVAQTLTAGANLASGYPVGASVLWLFTDEDLPRSGVYTVTDAGADDPGGSPAVFTRRADFDASEDFSGGASVTSGAALWSFVEVENFALDVDDVIFRRLGPEALVADGLAGVPSEAAAATPSLRALGTSATEAAPGDDTRLSDARTPTLHAASHASGPDAITPSAIGTYSAAQIDDALGVTALAAATAGANSARASFVTATTTTPSLTSTSGWTNSTSGAGATSTLNTGTGRVEFGVNDNGGTARIIRTIAVPADYRAQLRIRSFTDTTANVQLTLSIYNAIAPSEGPRYTVYGDGGLRAQYVNAAAATITVRAQTAAIAAVRTALTAGTLWLRAQSLGGTVSYQYAIGATEASLAWIVFASYALPGTGDGERLPDTFNAGLNRIASAGAQTATLDSVSYRDLSP